LLTARGRLLLLCSFAAALVFEAAQLDRLSLGYDELFSVYFAQQDIGYLLGEGRLIETNPPLYYAILHYWMLLFGDSAFVVRLPSLLASAATLPVIYRIARAVRLGPGGAWLAGALYLTSALGARYALLARGYALWLLFLAIALWALVEALSAAPARVWRWAALFAGAGLASLYVHDSTVIFLAAANLVFAVWWVAMRRAAPSVLVAWVLPQLALLVAGAPQLLVILAQRHSANIAWIPPPDILGFIQTAIELLSGHEYPFGRLQSSALTLSLLLLVLLAPARAPRSILPLAGLVLAGPALLWGMGLLLARAALWLLLPLAVIEASAVSAFGRRWLIVAAPVIFGLNTAFCLIEYLPEPSWRDTLAALDAGRSPGDAIVLLNGAPVTAFRYFKAGDGAAFYRWDVTPVDGPGTAIRAIDDRLAALPPIDEAGIRALLRQGRAVWLISRLRAQVEIEGKLAMGYGAMRSFALTRIAPAAP
jgi:hypothetical protein